MARRRELTADFYARKAVAARAKLEAMAPTPRPRQSLQAYNADHAANTRRVGCVNYGACLDLAFSARWEGFSCDSCSAFTLPSRESFMSDMEGLTLLLAAVVKRRPMFLEEDEGRVWNF